MSKWGNWLGAVILVVFFALPALFGLYGDFLWFTSLGYQSVFLRIMSYRIGLFLLTTILSAAILYLGYYWTVHNIRKDEENYETNSFILLGIALVSVFIGLSYSGSWDTVLRFISGTPFNVFDPVFGQDASFFVFDLAFFKTVVNFLLLTSIISLVSSAIIYASRYGLEDYDIVEPMTGNEIKGQNFSLSNFWDKIKDLANLHISTCLGFVLILIGGSIFLSRYDLLFSQYGAVLGIGYTEANVILPLLALLSAMCMLGGLLVFANAKLKSKSLLSGVILAIVIVAVLGNIGGALVQNFVVEPDEFNKERSFLEREIKHTNDAFALNRISEEEFPVSPDLSKEDIQENPGTIDNVRLWDWRPLLKTYNELQIFRTYYTFMDVDVDRYEINGSEMEVMVSPREMDTDSLPAQSQSWVNRHLVYTHGFGVTMSPVREVSSEGLPELIVKDIPPQSSVGIDIEQPRIYYGENTGDYAITNTNTQEFDYPSGDQNVYGNYQGSGGVQIDSFLDKVAFAFKFGSSQIFFSDSIHEESRIMFHRDIRDRVRTLAPFLEFDADPYVVVSEGKMYWIYDAYTTTDKYPYSRTLEFKGDDVNYIRNSVKVVVDAYTGETDLYVADDEDPVISTYQKIFPSMFKHLDEMPSDLRKHVRYPEDIFKAQSLMYLDYHMKDPQVFYNKEDQWRIPNEILRGATTPMEPYYIIMKLPGEDEAEFIQIMPFIPRGKENMIGWLAARSDPPNYGNLKSFLFSKQELIFGPMQIESRIDQDTEISQRITLWSQSGSSVLRGNLLAIPIEDTIMYVEPLFLQSRGEGSLPELKRVIVAQGDRLTMQPTLEESLGVLFGEIEEEETVPATPSPDTVEAYDLSTIKKLYEEAQEALRNGDFVTYSERISEIGIELNKTD